MTTPKPKASKVLTRAQLLEQIHGLPATGIDKDVRLHASRQTIGQIVSRLGADFNSARILGLPLVYDEQLAPGVVIERTEP